MIAFLKGIVAAKFAQKAYLDVNGVGFEVNMSLTGIASLPDVGSPASVLTYLQTRDDGIHIDAACARIGDADFLSGGVERLRQVERHNSEAAARLLQLDK